jgi:protein-S-isoprenylcysteine O-methyltransferase Ste14
MLWMPVFSAGWWNAWILFLFVLLHPLVMNLIDRTIGTGKLNQKMGETPVEADKKKGIPIPTMFLVIIFVLSIFIPLRLGVIWLYIGLAIYFTGMAVFFSSIITAARTPLGSVFTRGMYRYSRHPLYLSFLIIFFGISVASLSWLFLILSMLWMVFPFAQVTPEEQGCLESFGNAYREYMEKTPKCVGLPK